MWVTECLNWTEFHESLILIDWTNPNIKFRHVNNFVEGFLFLSILPSTTILILKGTKRTIRRKKESFNNICLFWFFLVSLNEIKVCFPFIIPSIPSGLPPPPPSTVLIYPMANDVRTWGLRMRRRTSTRSMSSRTKTGVDEWWVSGA